MNILRGLVVEDDDSLARAIGEMLSKLGLEVTIVNSVKAATKSIDKKEYNLGVVDRSLIDGDGLEIVEYAREIQYPMKILLLSGHSNTTDRIGGLEKGASDYVGKPFSYKELELRLERLVFSDKRIDQQTFNYRELCLYPQTGELFVKGRKIQLRSKESAVLCCLIRHQRQVVTRNMLIEYVWGSGGVIPDYKTVDVYIRRLRMRLGKSHSMIRVVRNAGFILE
jgi:DNA-binding response OmpR family regulator